MKHTLIVVCALGGSLGAAMAEAHENVTLTGTDWVQKAPSFEDMIAAYPAAARAKGQGGAVMVDCAFTYEGRLSHCQTIEEKPIGGGFRKAALALTGQFQGPTRLDDGSSIAGAHAQFHIVFAPEILSRQTVVTPEWSALPTAAQFTGAFPDAAAKAGVLKARVAMACKVGPDGGLVGCAPVSEDPPGYGFGAATLPLAPLVRVKLWGSDGRPVVGGEVRVPIRYDLQQGKP